MSSLPLEKIHHLTYSIPKGVDGVGYACWNALRKSLGSVGLLAKYYDMSATGPPENPTSIMWQRRWNGQSRQLCHDEIEEYMSSMPNDVFRIEPIGDDFPDHYIQLHGGFSPYISIGSRDFDCCFVAKYGKDLTMLLAQYAPLHLCYILNTGYGSWMACNDIASYERKYGTAKHFSLRISRSSSIDFLALDTSKNPGRIQRSTAGYRIAVAADMWLGPSFWPEAACTPEEVRAQPWLKVVETEHYMHINCWPEPFTRPDGEQGELQKKLWRLLFNSDCEWPPNGGVPQPRDIEPLPPL